jgi:hypothetical protein
MIAGGPNKRLSLLLSVSYAMDARARPNAPQPTSYPVWSYSPQDSKVEGLVSTQRTAETAESAELPCLWGKCWDETLGVHGFGLR